MTQTESTAECLVCARKTDVTPLISLAYRGGSYFICPQHLPVLIHNPGELAGMLPGAENLTPSDHHD